MNKITIASDLAPVGSLYYTFISKISIVKLLSRTEGYSSMGWDDPNADSLKYEDLWTGEINVLDSRSVMARHFNLIQEDNYKYIIDKVFNE